MRRLEIETYKCDDQCLYRLRKNRSRGKPGKKKNRLGLMIICIQKMLLRSKNSSVTTNSCSWVSIPSQKQNNPQLCSFFLERH